MTRESRFLTKVIPCLISIVVWMLFPALGHELDSFQEIWKKSQVFEPQPTLDTTPVVVKVGSIVYRIPRNYLIFTDQLPTLKLTWPGLNPLSEETRKCFGSVLQSQQAGCTSIEFRLFGSGGPAPGGRAFTNAEKFDNFRKHSVIIGHRAGPFGYDVYETGPVDARIETYRNVVGDILFHCLFSGTNGQRRLGVCDDSFRLDDLNHVQFFFKPDQIEHIAEIENHMRNLIKSFAINGAGSER